MWSVSCLLWMLCLSAWKMRFVKMVFAVCMSGGGRMSDLQLIHRSLSDKLL